MKMSIAIEINNEAELVEITRRLTAKFVREEVSQADPTPEAPKVKKEKPVEKVEEAPEVQLGFDEDEKTEEASSPKELQVTDVIDALKKYSSKNGREKAAKILAKFGCKSVHDLKAEKYESIIQVLSK